MAAAKKGLLVGLSIAFIVAVVLGGLGLALGLTYNNLVSMDEDVSARWAEIDNQLKRRADLIPNLVETVKGFAAQEQTVIGDIADARAALVGAQTPAEAAEANAALDGALGRLLLIVENYPELKSDQTFIGLMDELAGTENRIAVARRDYNEAVRTLNVAVRQFPTNFVANIFGFEKAEFFEIGGEDTELPEVDF